MDGGLMHSFCNELVKIAAPSIKERVESHFRAEKPDWSKFESGLKNGRFRSAILGDVRADEKLKRYTEANGSYHSSKNIVAIIPSRTSSKRYKVKKLPSGRLACNCKDWQYKHSHEGTDCDHVLLAQSKMKP